MKKLLFFVLLISLCLCLPLTAAAADTVYVRDGGTGNGQSADAPLGDLADAIAALPFGGTVVLAGDCSLGTSYAYDASVPAFISPAADGVITITGKDFGGRLLCPDGSRFFCTANTVFEHLSFRGNGKTFVMAGRFFDVTVGEGCTMDALEMHLIGGMEHTNASATVPDDDYTKDAHVTVLSGTVAELTGLGRNVARRAGANYTGTAYITIGGDAKVGRLFGAYRWGSKTVTGGAVVLTLDGGAITHYVTGCGSEEVAYNVDVTVRITENMRPERYFTAVTPGYGDNNAFMGLNGGALYNTATNYGRTVLDIAAAPQITEEWLNTYVCIESFSSITGKTTEDTDMQVVYVSSRGDNKNSGATSATAVATLDAAFKKLRDGGTIVISGAVAIDTETAANFPEHAGTVTLTSVYDNVDYRETGAKLSLTRNLFLGGDTVFTKIDLYSDNGVSIYCRGNSLHLAEEIETTYATNPIAIWGGNDSSLPGLTAASLRYFDYSITIDSGEWYYVRGGSIRTGETQPVGTIGNVAITINGGTITSTTTQSSMNGIVAVGGFDALEGDASVTIGGGVIGCSVMGIGRPGYNSTASNSAYARGDVTITVTGGTFRAGTVIGACHDAVASELDGDFFLTVQGGNFPQGFGGFNAESVLGNAVIALPDALQNAKQVGFDTAFFAANGAEFAKLAENIKGGVLVITGAVNVDSLTLAAYDSLRITSVWNGTDYRKAGAKLTVNDTLSCGGDTVIESITLSGDGTLSGGGHDLTLGKNITTEGHLRLTDGVGKHVHVLTVESGSYFSAEVGANAALVAKGGFIGNVKGDMVSFRGGSASNVEAYAPSSSPSVLYVRNGGTGDGRQFLTAMGSLAEAAKALPKGGTIVICGKVTVDSAVTLGAHTLTSIYDGIDYRITDGAHIELSRALSFTGDATLKALDIVAKANGTYLCAEGNSLTVDEDVHCRIFKGNRTEKYPALVAGSVATSTSLRRDLHLTVKSGTWGGLSGGQFSTEADSASTRRIEGNITVDVFGGKFTDDCFIAGKNNLAGNAVWNVYGGEFACSVFGIVGEAVTVRGDITLNAFGGEFSGDIRAAQNDLPTLDGTYTVNVHGADLSRASTVLGAEALAGNNVSHWNVAENRDFTKPLAGNITYQNPIAGFADPSIVYDGGYYYYTYASGYKGGMGLWMARAVNLCDIGKVEPVLIWSQKLTGEAPEMTALWAPQLYYMDGRWYIYAAAQTSRDTATGQDRRYPYVWVGTPDDPMGDYDYFGCMENIDEEVFSYLSPRVIKHGGKWYMFMSGFYSQSDTNPHTQRMRVCELASPTKMASKQIVISSPVYDYEKGIMEGPYPFYAPDGTLFMLFAAGHTRTDLYCTGVMRFNGGENDSLLDASKWEKFAEPLQYTDYASFVYSPGAMVVTTSPYGNFYGVYHAKEYHYSAYSMRRMHMQKITFVNGLPQMDAPHPIDTVFSIEMNPMPIADRVSGFTKSGTTQPFASDRFAKARAYDGRFTDVAESAWFAPYVKTAYEFALANGTSATKFSPNGKFTVAQALTAAANIHTAYFGTAVRGALAGEKWYDPYVDYCIENGIILAAQFDNVDRNITRGEMATVFAAVLPMCEYDAVREGANPDVTRDMACAAAVEKLYRAGIVGGDAGTGNFRPQDEIVRSEACVIFTRLAEKAYRAK